MNNFQHSSTFMNVLILRYVNKLCINAICALPIADV